MKLIDTHCHLYLEEFRNDIEAVIKRGEDIGIQKFYLPAIDSTAINDMIEMEERFPGRCIAMMGLHPCYVKDNYKDELATVAEWLAKRRFAAIGEIGLDFYWDKTFINEQKEAFGMQMQWAIKYDMPIVIHSRDAMQDTIDLVKQYAPEGLRGIFHCFGGSYSNAADIISAGFFLGIGGVLTYKKSGLAEVLSAIDLEYLVLETDAPYLTPVPFRGRRNESSYLQYILEKLADIKGCSIEEVAAITTRNAEKIFGV